MVMVLMAPAAGVQCFHDQDPRLCDNSCNTDGKCLFEGCAMGRGFQPVDDGHAAISCKPLDDSDEMDEAIRSVINTPR